MVEIMVEMVVRMGMEMEMEMVLEAARMEPAETLKQGCQTLKMRSRNRA